MNNKRSGNSVIFIVIIVFLIVALACVYYFGFIKKSEEITRLNDELANVQTNSNVAEIKSSNMTEDEAKQVAEDIYSKAYDAINEGIGLNDGSIINLTIGNQTVEAYKIDFSKIEPYFTENKLNQIKLTFADERREDGNYRTLNNFYNSSSRLDFMSTIFGVTDQAKRQLDIKTYSDSIIVAKSVKVGKMAEKYIIFVKENDTWKIDMFE